MEASFRSMACLAAEQGAPALEEEWRRIHRERGLLGLASAQDLPLLRQAVGEGEPGWLPDGSALVVGSGGSSGGRRWCLQPLANLEASAAATGAWLQDLAIDPARALLVNPLPWHHVSGLMPWLRSQLWGAEHQWLPAARLRRPEALPPPRPPVGGEALLSLVPTQLHRLLAHPAGVLWLRHFAVIWVGGAPLAEGDAVRSREARLRLAPCYGSTETGSMVTALAPEAFLAAQGGCGPALAHARLRIATETGAVEVRAPSLSPGHLVGGRLLPLAGPEGWWRSGDRGRLDPGGLTLLGRLDGALQSGGETVFPEEVEQQLQKLAHGQGLPLEAVLLLARPDVEWGQRLVALVRGQAGADGRALIVALRIQAARLPPAQRPKEWWLCPELERNGLGKWERGRWQVWLSAQI